MVDVPGFAGDTSPSSLLLTGRMLSAGDHTGGDTEKDEKSAEPRGIDIEGLRFYPQPENVFRRGGSIHMVYGLYNVSSELTDAPPAPRIFLLFGDKPLDRPPVKNYDAFPSADRREVHYVATLDTKTLEPGDYKLLVIMPNGNDAIPREFRLVP